MNLKQYIEKIINSKDKTKYVALIGIVGIVLILVSTIFNQKPNEECVKPISEEPKSSTDEYVNQLEEKINGIVSQIDGVGNSKVLITIEKGIENVYANSEKKTTNSDENFSGKTSKKDDIQKDIVLIDGSKGKKALMITQKEPTVKGVVVVCDGADDALIVKRVTDAVTKALNIKTNRLSVVKKSTIKQ